MKLFRFGERGKERPGFITDDGACFDLGWKYNDFDAAFFARGGPSELRAMNANEIPDSARLDETTLGREVRLGAPIGPPGKFIGVGLNYAEHAREAGLDVPAEPLIFLTSPTAIAGPDDTIHVPNEVRSLDWEVELAFVVGATVRRSHKVLPEGAIAGFMLHNDLSVRDWQLHRSGQWTKGKSADGLSPLGPFLVLADDRSKTFDLSLDVNGRRMQQVNTGKMVFGVAELAWHISRYMTLQPGDVISTGTPSGVAFGRPERPYLQPGDVIEIDGGALGSMRHMVLAAETSP